MGRMGKGRAGGRASTARGEGGRARAAPPPARRASGRGGVRAGAGWDIGEMYEDATKRYEDAAEWVGKTVDSMRFENWAPRSSRAWRLREYKSESDASQYRGGAGAGAGAAEEELGGEAVAMLERSLRDVDLSKLGLQCEDYEDGMECALEVDDEVGAGGDLAAELSSTIDERYRRELLAAPPLTGQELADLVYAKYGKFHDMCVKNQCLSKGNTRRWVALNIYIGHLGQRSFPMSTEEYVQKLNSVAQICTGLRQAAYVRQFFAEKPIPRRGLPSRPRADTAVSLRLKYVAAAAMGNYSAPREPSRLTDAHVRSPPPRVRATPNSRSPTWSDDIAEEFFSS